MEQQSRAYKLGRLVSEGPVAAVVVVAALIGATWGLMQLVQNAYERDKVEKQQADKARLLAESIKRTEAAAAAARKCVADQNDLFAKVKKLLASGDVSAANAAFNACRAHLKTEDATNLAKQVDAAVTARNKRLQMEESARAAKLLAEEKARKRREGVSIGMTEQEVLDSSWGKPKRIRSTTTASGTDQQWIYDGGNYLYFSNGKLRAVQN